METTKFHRQLGNVNQWRFLAKTESKQEVNYGFIEAREKPIGLDKQFCKTYDPLEFRHTKLESTKRLPSK